MRPFGVSGRRRIVVSDQPPPAGDGARCMKPPTRPPVPATANIVPGGVELVHRHREAALRLVAAPHPDTLELARSAVVDVLGRDDPEAVARLRQADTDWRTLRIGRPSSENVPGRSTASFADRDRAHAERAVARQGLARRAEHREPPAARVRDAPELGEQRVELRGVADGIAADERGARHDAVREERAPGRREEEALVTPQGEEGEAVAAVLLDEVARDPPLPDRLRDGLRQRPQPQAERGEAQQEADGREQVARAIGQLRAAQLDAERDERRGKRPRSRSASTGRTARGSPGTSKRRRHRRSAASSSSDESTPRSRGPSRDARPPPR